MHSMSMVRASDENSPRESYVQVCETCLGSSFERGASFGGYRLCPGSSLEEFSM